MGGPAAVIVLIILLGLSGVVKKSIISIPSSLPRRGAGKFPSGLLGVDPTPDDGFVWDLGVVPPSYSGCEVLFRSLVSRNMLGIILAANGLSAGTHAHIMPV